MTQCVSTTTVPATFCPTNGTESVPILYHTNFTFTSSGEIRPFEAFLTDSHSNSLIDPATFMGGGTFKVGTHPTTTQVYGAKVVYDNQYNYWAIGTNNGGTLRTYDTRTSTTTDLGSLSVNTRQFVNLAVDNYTGKIWYITAFTSGTTAATFYTADLNTPTALTLVDNMPGTFTDTYITKAGTSGNGTYTAVADTFGMTVSPKTYHPWFVQNNRWTLVEYTPAVDYYDIIAIVDRPPDKYVNVSGGAIEYFPDGTFYGIASYVLADAWAAVPAGSPSHVFTMTSQTDTDEIFEFKQKGRATTVSNPVGIAPWKDPTKMLVFNSNGTSVLRDIETGNETPSSVAFDMNIHDVSYQTMSYASDNLIVERTVNGCGKVINKFYTLDKTGTMNPYVFKSNISYKIEYIQ